MKNLANETKEDLIKIRDEYIKKYIGDFNKPFEYKLNLKYLDKLIIAKG